MGVMSQFPAQPASARKKPATTPVSNAFCSLMITPCCRSNALVQPQARYHHGGGAAAEKCLSAATFVMPHRVTPAGEGLLLPRVDFALPQRRSASAGPAGVRRPCSQFRKVATKEVSRCDALVQPQASLTRPRTASAKVRQR